MRFAQQGVLKECTISYATGDPQTRLGLLLRVRFRSKPALKQTISFREGFRMLLGVRKCPENESLLLRAVAMGISVGGVVCWGCLGRGLAGLRLTSVYCVVSVSA
ncbi:hypothetical protein AEM38_02955 [Hyphomonadaceae bacterium UKL13-1]|nr:hypothetical protein AEM38_02955 [Hyphomonadaceae bacterium UKL13-1]